MTALTADAVREIRGIGNMRVHKVPVAAATTIYKGALVSIDADGYAIPAVDTAALNFFGLAEEKGDNSAGADGAVEINVLSNIEVKLPATSITQIMLGDLMYVADDNEVDDAAGPTNDIAVGILTEFVSTTEGWVYIPTGGTNAL